MMAKQKELAALQKELSALEQAEKEALHEEEIARNAEITTLQEISDIQKLDNLNNLKILEAEILKLKLEELQADGGLTEAQSALLASTSEELDECRKRKETLASELNLKNQEANKAKQNLKLAKDKTDSAQKELSIAKNNIKTKKDELKASKENYKTKKQDYQNSLIKEEELAQKHEKEKALLAEQQSFKQKSLQEEIRLLGLQTGEISKLDGL